MKKKEGFVLRRVGDEAIVVGESLKLINFDSLVSLNPSAAYVWEALGNQPFDAANVAELLTGRYEVDDATATADAHELLDTWIKAAIIEA